MDFTLATLQSLRAAGWETSRDVDVTQYGEEFWKQSFRAQSVVSEFLKSIGSPTLVPFNVVFGAVAASRVARSWSLGVNIERVGAPLSPVGQALGRTAILLMDPSGRVLVGSDELIAKAADSPREALERLCRTGTFRWSAEGVPE